MDESSGDVVVKVHDTVKPGCRGRVLLDLGEACRKLPTQAKLIVYTKAKLAEKDEGTNPDADYEVVSMQGSVRDEPMNPMTMARNTLDLVGGTLPDVPYTAEQFAVAVAYWNMHVMDGRTEFVGSVSELEDVTMACMVAQFGQERPPVIGMIEVPVLPQFLSKFTCPTVALSESTPLKVSFGRRRGMPKDTACIEVSVDRMAGRVRIAIP
jgi:hypothetical protein